jgi:hypothetical protein
MKLKPAFMVMILAFAVRSAEPERFEALCPNCNTHIQNAIPISIKTNRFEPMMMGAGGYTNLIVDVQLQCPKCQQTNSFESEIMTHKPRARHLLRPPLPLRENPPPIPLLSTNPSPTVVTVKVPAGFELQIVPTVHTNNP